MFHFLKSDMKTQSAVFHFLNFKSKLSVIFAQCIHKISQNINLCLYLINADWNKGIRKISKNCTDYCCCWSIPGLFDEVLFKWSFRIVNSFWTSFHGLLHLRSIMEGQTLTIFVCWTLFLQKYGNFFQDGFFH